MNELTKRIVSCVLLLIIGLGCFFRHFGMAVFTGDAPDEH